MRVPFSAHDLTEAVMPTRGSPATNSAKRIVSGDDFRRWRDSQGLSLLKVADYLGIARGSAQYLDDVGLTKTQALAIAAILAGLEPWTPQGQESA